jgi:outer membrane receptor protein involved in Fe transport
MSGPTRSSRHPLSIRFVTCVVALCLLGYGTATAASAQTATATLSGTVEDQNGAVVPDVQLTVTNQATALERQTTTNEEGTYTVPLLPPGTYTVTAQRDGFANVVIRDVVLNVNDQRSLLIQLRVGGVGETVTVTAASAVREDPAVATVVDRQFVENLPLNGRSFQALLELTPGAVVIDRPPGGLEKGGFSVNGQRPNANYFTVDGVSANSGASSGAVPGQSDAGSVPALTAFGGTNNLVSVDALEEFKVLTSSYAPEFGRTPGAQVSIITRSGTNDFHGTVFEYLRNDALDANDWFANSRGLAKPPLRQNDFGGVFGGPLVRDRTFFFFSYEGLRLRQPQSAIVVVPSMDSRAAAPSRIQPILNAFPVPNGGDLGDGLAEFSASYSDRSNLDATSIRVDHLVRDDLTVFGRYNYAPSDIVQRVDSLSTLLARPNRTQTLTVGTTWTINQSAVNDLRVNWSEARAALTLSPDDFRGAIPPPESALFPAGIPADESQVGLFIGAGAVLDAGVNNNNYQRQFNLVDNLSVISGSHQMKFGVDYRRLAPELGRAKYSLFVIFDTVADALAETASLVFVNAAPGRAYPVYNNLSLYAQDTWKVTPRLTLTYGLRWEYNPPPSEKNGNHPAVVTGLESPATFALAPFGTPLWNASYNNFAPRAGLAYQLSERQGWETVVRGGWGIFYDLGNGQASQPFGLAYPFVSSKLLFGVPYPLDAASTAPPPFETDPPYGTVYAFDPDLELPYSVQWNFAVEQSLGANQVVSASYVAAVGRRLLAQEVYAQPNPTFTEVSVTRNSATSDYHALQLQYQRRLSHGLQAMASYTWSHSIDTESSDAASNAPSTTFSLDQERGPSDFDVRHAFSAAVTYNIPAPPLGEVGDAILGDWSTDAIFRARSATPVNVVMGTDPFGLGLPGELSVVRPDVVPGVPFYVDDLAVAGGWRLNRAAFAAPPAGRQGSLGRNSLRGFALSQLDLTARRQFNLTERVRLQFRAELFNVFNRPNFADPVPNLNSPLFGQSTRMLGRSLQGLSSLYQIGGPRSVQFALRLGF